MNLDLTLACGEYDLTESIRTGDVEPDGIDLNVMTYPAPERHRRGIDNQEFDVCEISFGSYLTSQASPDPFPFTAIPVFPHRRFRHSYMFKHAEADIDDPGDFAGKRVGLEMWQTTSCVWMRGIAAEHYGLDLESVTWFVHQPEDLELDVSDRFDVRMVRRDEDMERMLTEGDLDGAFYPVVLDSIKDPGSGVERVFPDSLDVERTYYEDTGIFPIMHTVVVRDEILQRHPWVAVNLLNAFREARDTCLRKLEDPRWTALAWARQHLEHQQSVIGENPWPYGVEGGHENWAVIGKLQEYAVDQGIIPGEYDIEELFFDRTIGYETKRHLSGSHG